MNRPAGSKLGSYEITALIGAGGMGEVYRARDTKLQRDVAIKILPESVSKDRDALERFEREAHAVAALSHPNILAIYDLGKEDGVSFAVMEISPDGRLVSYVAAVGPERAGGRDGSIRVVRFEDGAPVPVEVIAYGGRANRGRHRWLPGGDAFVFLTDDEKGDHGIAMQNVTPGGDTSATRRVVTGFTKDALTESLGISPDGARMTVAEIQFSASLLLAEGVDGIVVKETQGGKQP